MQELVVFWFRRDLRLEDNHGLWQALTSGCKVLPIFIFDTNILDKLPKDDHRLSFIHSSLEALHISLQGKGKSGIATYHDTPLNTFKKLLEKFPLKAVYCNEDYEPYARKRDEEISGFLRAKNVAFNSFTDHVLNHPSEVLKAHGTPYSVFTPYKNKALAHIEIKGFARYPSEKHLEAFIKQVPNTLFHSLPDLGFLESKIPLPKHNYNAQVLEGYADKRDYPAANNTSRLSTHLRFGLISTRGIAKEASKHSVTYVNELIWRDFYQMILWHHPHTTTQSFKPTYDRIKWSNNEGHFEKWCAGETGFPMVDAGMRELNATGFMHNRVRMIVASFLCKDLQIDWRWGEAYFAEKLYDFELASNVGGWQWAASSGCDAAPYFRIFNPDLQQKRFDPDFTYIKKWVTEFGTDDYPKPMVDHKKAKALTLAMYDKALKG